MNIGSGRQSSGVRLGARLALSAATLIVTMVVVDRVVGRIVPPVPPIPVSHPPNFVERRTTIEFDYEFRTNSMGLRYRELPFAKADREFRLIVVGDSMTEGYGVADGQRFSDRLETMLSRADRPVSVVNAGLGGRAPLEYGRVLFTVGLKYQPDLALIVVHANDPEGTAPDARLDVTPNGEGGYDPPPQASWEPGGVTRTLAFRLLPWTYRRLQYWSKQRETRHLDTLGYLQLIDERARRQHVAESAVQAWKARVPRRLMEAAERKQFNGAALAIGLFDPNHWIDALDIDSPAAMARWVGMERVLGDIIARCTESRLRCALVYSPAAVQFDPASGSLERAVGIHVRREWLTERSEAERRLAEWAHREAVPYLSLTEEFRKVAALHPGTLSYEIDGHYNPDGHRVAAEAIGAWLRELRLIPD